MATILTKKSDTASAVPLAGDLTNSTGGAELAVNTADKRLFTKTSGGTVVEVGTNPTILNVDNIQINGNAITSTDTNGNIDLTPNGTGEVNITKVDIDSGAIDGTAIGASSASTGAFTTLAASSTVTLSGGTANGVLYLNGSKVATSGSALTFDGTTLNNSGAFGTSTAALTLKNSSAASSSNIVEQQFFASNSFSGLDTIAKFGALNPSAGANNYGAFYWSLANAGSPAEQMRLTSTGLGIGTSSPGYPLEVTKAGGANFVGYFKNTTNGTPYTLRVQEPASPASGYPLFDVVNSAGTNAYFLIHSNTGNVGIGTSSPSYKLHIAGSAATNTTGIGLTGSTTGYQRILMNNTSGGAQFGIEGSSGGTICVGSTAYATVMGSYQNYPTQVITNNNVVATFDTSGNLGLGVTPSAWSLGKALQIGTSGAAALLGYNNNFYLTANAYYDGGWKYAASSAAASRYQAESGTHSWSTAPSGTAGNAITFSQVMTLDASGNLGIGTTSLSNYANQTTFTINGTDYGRLDLKASNTLKGSIFGGGDGLNLDAGSNQLVMFAAGSERARIDSSGNLLVGTTTTRTSYGQATQKLQIQGSTTTSGGAAFNSFGNDAFASNLDFFKSRGTGSTNTIVQSGDTLGKVLWSGADGTSYIPAAAIQGEVDGTPGTNDMPGRLVFYTTADGAFTVSERMRIDSSGNLLVGTTSAIAGSSGPCIHGYNASNASLRLQRTNDGGVAVFYHSAGTAVGSISVTSSATAYNTSSDYRLKENIAPMTGALDKVAALKPCTYTWKVDGSAGEGFIAHELAEVVPQCVTGEKDAVDADGNPQYQGVDTSFLVATLTAAIQELKSELDSVKAELAILKGN